jgi:hypothetical protein
MYKRHAFYPLFNRLKEPRKFIQVLAGPRQSGKTTLIQQVMKEIPIPSHYAAADAISMASSIWVEQQWDIARLKMKNLPPPRESFLVLDEIQKIPNWGEVVKKLWDEDTLNEFPLRVVLLGSSPLLFQKGITETLAGRYELVCLSHWSYQEMKKAFNFSLDQYIYFGGYPGASSLISDEGRWHQNVRDSLIETTISRDILMMARIDKPALLKRLFELGCLYSGQILSFNKILGQLQEAGNTTTLSHYLELLSSAGMLRGLQKYSPEKLRQKASSPKFQVMNTALITAQSEESFNETRLNPERWGHLLESAVGAHLVNESKVKQIEVYYWREKNKEVDFILEEKGKLIAIEVKSGKKKGALPGIQQFSKKYSPHKKLIVGKGGLELEEFFSLSLEDFF